MIKSGGKDPLPEIELDSETLESNMNEYRSALDNLKTILQVKQIHNFHLFRFHCY